MSLDESLREELKRLYLTGHDIGDAGYPEPHKTDDSYIDASLAKIKALVVESLPENKRPDENMKAKYTVKQLHLLEGYMGSIGGYNQCLGEIRSIWNTK